jgi:acetoin utilization protein AcuB
MKSVPMIKSVMTPFPHSVDLQASVVEAQVMMAEHNIRHLPCKRGVELVGVVTDRDIKKALATGQRRVPAESLLVEDVYVPEAYVVDLMMRLDSVLLYMADTHIGSVLVTRKGRLAGIFTLTDACRCYGEYLRSKFPTEGGSDLA